MGDEKEISAENRIEETLQWLKQELEAIEKSGYSGSIMLTADTKVGKIISVKLNQERRRHVRRAS